MGRIIDLRSYNIKSDDDVVEFLDLFEAKIPQIKDYVKKQKFRRVSLENQVVHLNGEVRRAQGIAPMEVINPDASVSERVQGNTRPVRTDEQKHLEQMRRAQTVEETVTVDPLTPAAPGEIGHLEVSTIEGHAPVDEAGELPPDLRIVTTEDDRIVTDYTPSEAEVVAAAGSKSERPADDDVQSETESSEDTIEEKVYTQFQLGDDVYQQLIKGDDVRYTKNSEDITGEIFGKAQAEAEGTAAPSEADLKSVGDLVAEKTDNGKNRG